MIYNVINSKHHIVYNICYVIYHIKIQDNIIYKIKYIPYNMFYVLYLKNEYIKYNEQKIICSIQYTTYDIQYMIYKTIKYKYIYIYK